MRLKRGRKRRCKRPGSQSRSLFESSATSARSGGQNTFIERSRVEQAVDHIHTEAEKNWHLIVKQIESIGTRLTDAAKSAWNSLTAFV
jgi:hypothetical protein